MKKRTLPSETLLRISEKGYFVFQKEKCFRNIEEWGEDTRGEFVIILDYEQNWYMTDSSTLFLAFAKEDILGFIGPFDIE